LEPDANTKHANSKQSTSLVFQVGFQP